MLVAVQAGTRERTAPVVCVPGAGAGAASFISLADALGPGETVLAFQARGL